MKRIILIIMMAWVSTIVIAQNPENAIVIHLQNSDDVQILIDDVDSLFVDTQGGTEQVNVRMNDKSLRSYALRSIEYMNFAYVEQGPQAINLGLSSLWASYNIGASKPEEVGYYFSWGETTPKEDYSEATYLYYVNYTYEHIGNNISGTKYDAATAQWGNQWRMPNIYEINELMNCEWTSESVNGVNGFRVTGKNGNSIFLPATGYMRGEECVDKNNCQGYYWSSSQDPDMTSSAYNINFKGYTSPWSANRSYGFPIRAVRDYN